MENKREIDKNTQIQSFTIVGRLSIVVYIWCEGVVNFRAHILKIMRGSFSHCNNFRQISSCKVNRIKEKGKQCKLVVMRQQMKACECQYNYCRIQFSCHYRFTAVFNYLFYFQWFSRNILILYFLKCQLLRFR